MACEQLQLLPEEVMVLEDSENGCRAAIDANTFAVAVPGRHNEGRRSGDSQGPEYLGIIRNKNSELRGLRRLTGRS